MSNSTRTPPQPAEKKHALSGSIFSLGVFLHEAWDTMPRLLDDNFVLLDPTRRSRASALFRSLFLSLRNQSHMSLYLSLTRNSTMIFPQCLNMESLCADLLDSADALLQYTGKRITLRVEPGIYCVTGDANLLETAILNVIANAAYYSPDDQPVEATLRSSRGCTILSVTDHGGKLTPADCKSIFVPGGSREPDVPDTAKLGLYIAREIMRLHKGTILVSAEPGVRTTFTMKFPQDAKLPLAMHAPPTSYNERDAFLLLTELSPVLDKSVYTSKFFD